MTPSRQLWEKVLKDFLLFLTIVLILAFIKAIILFVYYANMYEE